MAENGRECVQLLDKRQATPVVLAPEGTRTAIGSLSMPASSSSSTNKYNLIINHTPISLSGLWAGGGDVDCEGCTGATPLCEASWVIAKTRLGRPSGRGWPAAAAAGVASDVVVSTVVVGVGVVVGVVAVAPKLGLAIVGSTSGWRRRGRPNGNARPNIGGPAKGEAPR
jgi:hypothetical protein